MMALRVWWKVFFIDHAGRVQYLTPMWTTWAYAVDVAVAFGPDAKLARLPAENPS
jgi:hypothetical protein